MFLREVNTVGRGLWTLEQLRGNGHGRSLLQVDWVAVLGFMACGTLHAALCIED